VDRTRNLFGKFKGSRSPLMVFFALFYFLPTLYVTYPLGLLSCVELAFG